MKKLEMKSPDLTMINIDKIGLLFPNVITETLDDNGNLKKSIDFDLLRQELSSEIVDGEKERYQLTWPGKKEAILNANTSVDRTLRPVKEDSVDWDTTQNLYIEGDNLEVLKLLQESYLNKIKCIYIDPPYNTGSDFVYRDNFSKDKSEYNEESGQIDEEGNRLFQNTESNGRFHSDWLTMIYPRLKLARNMLRDDGIFFISIDEGEVANVRKACNEIFGEEKFIAQLIWKSRQNKDNRTQNGVSVDHEYVIIYGKNIRGAERNLRGYSNPDNDFRGAWTSANMVGLATPDRRPNLHYDLTDPNTGINYGCPSMGWRYDKNTMAKLISEGRIIWPSNPNGRPRKKSFVNELSSERTGYSSIICHDVYTRNGTADILNLFGNRVMDFPKPVKLINELICQAGLDQDDIILDFFSGSATSAHAVMQLNAEDGGNRKYIMVQIPEETPTDSEAYKAGYKNICEIGKERIRRAAKKIKEETKADIDYGFRVFRVDSSNMKDVYYTPEKIGQQDLFNFVTNIKEDRTEEDLLAQIMLEFGLELSLPIETRTMSSKKVFFVAGNSLAACFEKEIPESVIRGIAAEKPLRTVFRDSSFKNDAARINVEEIFKMISPSTEIRVI